MSNPSAPTPSPEPKKIWERSIVAFGATIATSAVVAAFGVYLFMRGEVDQRVEELIEAKLPVALAQDREMKVLSEQREKVAAALFEIAEVRAVVKNALEEAEAAENSASQAATALQARTKALDETVDVAKVLGRIDEVAQNAVAELDDRILAQLAFPSDAVVPFARGRPSGAQPNGVADDPCPDGWTRYREADGRMILGVGPSDDPFRKSGERTHSLTVAEMPSHDHGVYMSLREGPGHALMWSNNPSPGNDVASNSQGPEPAGVLEGGGEPHDNMPPYIALYFCKKEAE